MAVARPKCEKNRALRPVGATPWSKHFIAVALSIAEGTAKLHAARLFKKLGVSSRTEALAAALRRGLIRLS